MKKTNMRNDYKWRGMGRLIPCLCFAVFLALCACFPPANTYMGCFGGMALLYAIAFIRERRMTKEQYANVQKTRRMANDERTQRIEGKAHEITWCAVMIALGGGVFYFGQVQGNDPVALYCCGVLAVGFAAYLISRAILNRRM